MRRVRLFAVTAVLIAACPFGVLAQEKKVEITPFIGYTASGGLDVGANDIGDGVIVDRLTPKSSFSYGGLFEFFFSENWLLALTSASSAASWRPGFKGVVKRNLPT